MSALAETARAVDEVISGQFDLGRSLLATLEDENGALTSLDSEAIDAAGTKKLEQLRQLEALEHERTMLFDMHDIAANDFIALDGGGVLDGRWRQLLELLSRCRSLNETNGALVASQRRHVERALGLLYGTSTDAGVYDADGFTRGPGRGVSITTA
jgi:flagellar biosynthesis/type III secretory pathway chaperone